MNAIHQIKWPALRIGGWAGALGLALIVGGTTSFAQYGTPEQFGLPDTGLIPGTSSQPAHGRGGSGQEEASLPPNVTSGWKIRVCSEKTTADRIDFKLTPSGSKSSYGTGGSGKSSGLGGTGASDSAMGSAASEHTTAWSRGEATEIKVPAELRHAEKLRIEATPSQKDKKSSVCLIYDDHVAKKLNFDEREVSTVKQSENGECGC